METKQGDKQSRIDSCLEVVTNTVVGALVALITVLMWFPIMGKPLSTSESLSTVLVFTIISLLRSYAIRRIFNGRSVYQAIKGEVYGEV